MSNLQPFDSLTRPQRIALISILSGDAPSRTAVLAGVTARCIRNWRKLPVFQEALDEARRDFFSACRSHLNSSLAVAFQTVFSMAGGCWNDSDRLKASLFLLDRVAPAKISALAPPENESTSNKLNYLGQKTMRNKAERSGNPRNLGESSGAQTEPQGTGRYELGKNAVTG